jgi:hypothetical protein
LKQLQLKQHWDRRLRLALWLLTLLGLIAALPVGYERLQTEKSSKQVEFVFDYRDLIDIANVTARPAEFIDAQLNRLKEAGVHTFAVYESSLSELRNNRRLQYYSSRDLMLMRAEDYNPNENFTYIAFADRRTEEMLGPVIERAFARDETPVRPWTHAGQPGLVIETPLENATVRSLEPDPLTLEMLKAKGFNIAIRLSDRIKPFDEAVLEQQLAHYHDLGVRWIIFDGEAVTGFAEDADKQSLQFMASLLNQYGIGAAAIEGMRVPQKGLDKLAYLTDYNVVRLHSIPERDALLSQSALSDRIVLAVKDRNIRMIFLNAAVTRDKVTGDITHPIDNLAGALEGPDGAIQRIHNIGYETGTAQPFRYVHSDWQRPAKIVVLIGGVALIALVMSYFIPAIWTTAAFFVGLAGAAALSLRSAALLEQAMALGIGIAAPALAIVLAIRRFGLQSGWMEASADRIAARRHSGLSGSFGRRLSQAVLLYLRTAVITFIGIPYIVALLNNVTYMLVLQQYRGVSLLHLAPIALAALYVVFYRSGRLSLEGVMKFLQMNIKVWWVVAAAVAGAIGMYYLSRTGNAGQVLPLELWFRSALENTFGVRPRSKEFLLAHPALLLGLFLAVRYRFAALLFVIGVIGQLSMIDTFAHIHTPLDISFVRNLLGLSLGLLVGLILILVWQLAERGWKRWARPFTN